MDRYTLRERAASQVKNCCREVVAIPVVDLGFGPDLVVFRNLDARAEVALTREEFRRAVELFEDDEWTTDPAAKVPG